MTGDQRAVGELPVPNELQESDGVEDAEYVRDHLTFDESQRRPDGGALLQERFEHQPAEHSLQRSLAAVQDLVDEGNRPSESQGNVDPNEDASGPLPSQRRRLNNDDEPLPLIRLPLVRQERNPRNDYTEQREILYQAFPTVFPLAQGCGSLDGPLHLTTRQFLERHYSRRPATHQILQFSLHNVKFRSDTGRAMKAFVKTDSTKQTAWRDLVLSDDFAQRCENARANPASDDAKALMNQIRPIVMMSGAKIPFSPLERGTRAATELWSMVRYYGLPSAYWTVGLDEMRSAIICRVAGFLKPGNISNVPTESAADFWNMISTARRMQAAANATAAAASDGGEGIREDGDPVDNLPQFDFTDYAYTFGETFPQPDAPVNIWRHQMSAEITKDPVAVAILMHRMTDALKECLIGIPSEEKKTSVPDFSSRLRGAIGRARAIFDVTEDNGRGAIHWHGLCWSGLPLWLVQCSAGAGEGHGDKSLGKYIAGVLNHSFTSSVKPALHAANVLRMQNNQNLRPSYFCPPKISAPAQVIRDCGEVAICKICHHSHMKCCHREAPRIDDECRTAYGRPTASVEGPLHITTTNVNNSAVPRIHTATVPVPPPNQDISNLESCLRTLGIPGFDMRLLDYPMFRPLLSVPYDIVEPNSNVIAAALEREVLDRQMKRFLMTAQKLKIAPPIIQPNMDLDEYRNMVFMFAEQQLGLGAVRSEGAILDNEAMLQAIRQMPAAEKVKFFNVRIFLFLFFYKNIYIYIYFFYH